MYSPKPIPKPFQGKPKKENPLQPKPIASHSTLIEATEKPVETQNVKQNRLSPLAALLFLDIFTKQKDG